jgi:hypothetical protein
VLTRDLANFFKASLHNLLFWEKEIDFLRTNRLVGDLKSFHFQEIGWVISFPKQGNENKKYLYYKVEFIDLIRHATSQMILAEIVARVEFEENFPYTVGFFKSTVSKETDFKTAYLEIRILRSLEEFWKFLNDLNI